MLAPRRVLYRGGAVPPTSHGKGIRRIGDHMKTNVLAPRHILYQDGAIPPTLRGKGFLQIGDRAKD